MQNTVPISDVAIWFKHLPNKDLQDRLAELASEAEISLEVGKVKGRWRRMKRGVDGRLPNAIIPIGPMKLIWKTWYASRLGEHVEVRIVNTADDDLASQTALFAEWTSAEDEAAFCDL